MEERVQIWPADVRNRD